jgi:putative RecB family exonuclease
MDERTMRTNGKRFLILRPTRIERGLERASTDGTTYVSPSRLGLWLRCPAAYKRRYIDGVVAPTTPGLFLGKVVHRGLEFYYRYRQDGVRLFPEYVGEHIAKSWEAAVEEECIAFPSTDEERQLLGQAVDLVTTYLRQVPENEPPPMAVEERIEAPLIDPRTGENLGIPLVGVLDLVLDAGDGPVIVDFKTAARSSSQLDVMHELQLSCYSYLLRDVAGESEAGLEIRSLIKTKVPRLQFERYGPREARHFERLFDVIRAYLEAVDSNRYHIRPGIHCSFCDYRDAVCAA